MDSTIDRRTFMKLSGLGGLVLASSLPGCASMAGSSQDFSFVQVSDMHWGFENPKVNPEARQTLPRAIAAVNAMEQKPDFVVFTGDLTHTTDDARERRQRLREVKDMIGGLSARGHVVHTLTGEHDASLDHGEAYLEVFGGELHYAFDHKGIHFIVLDNTSQPTPVLGAAQIEWLKADLARRDADTPVVVFTHRPLFPLYPQWDWATRDGDAAIAALMPYRNVTVFYGHVHHENHFRTGHIEHHAALSTMFPLSPVGTMPQRTQLPWDAAAPYKGLGLRRVREAGDGTPPQAREIPLAGA